MQKRRCKGSLTKDIRWECIHTVINIRNCTNQWTVLHRILPGSGTPSIRPPEWRVSVTGSRVEAPIRSARSICMIYRLSGQSGSGILRLECVLRRRRKHEVIHGYITGNCTKDIDTRDTSIILLHDSAEKPTTVEALPDIIENILARPDTVILPITENTRPIHHIE